MTNIANKQGQQGRLEVDLSVYFLTIWKRKFIVLITTLAVMVVIAWGSVRAPSTYEAVTRLRIVPYSLGAPDYGSYVYFDRMANSYSEIVHSESVINRARDELGLEMLPKFELEIIPETELMRLTVVDTNPERAQQVANTLASLLIEENQASYMANPSIQDSFRDQLDELGNQISTLTAEYTRLFNAIPRNNQRLSEIQSTLDNLRQNYNRLLDSASQATIMQISRANALSVVEPAFLPTEAIGPNLQNDLLLGVLIGLVTGTALVFILESLNPRVHTLAQVEVATQSRIIAHIPRLKKNYRTNVFAGDWIAAEAFRRLRAFLASELDRQVPCYLLVTSAIPGEGKTSTSANLALAIARSGHSTLLVDADMLRPTLHKFYRLSNLVGLSTVLDGRSTFAESIHGVGDSNLHILCAGPSTSHSAELLGSPKFAQLLDDVMQPYDFVIFDSPAVLAAVDSLTIASHMSGVLWVMDQRKIDQRTLSNVREQFNQVGARVIGVVANRVRNDKNASWSKHYRPTPKSDRVFEAPMEKSRKTELVEW